MAGWVRRVSQSGVAWKTLLSQGACFMKLPAVEPKNAASRYVGSKSGASVASSVSFRARGQVLLTANQADDQIWRKHIA